MSERDEGAELRERLYLARIRDCEGRMWAARRLLANSDTAEATAVLRALNNPWLDTATVGTPPF